MQFETKIEPAPNVLLVKVMSAYVISVFENVSFIH